MGRGRHPSWSSGSGASVPIGRARGVGRGVVDSRSYNLTSTASMLGGTKLLRRHIWLVLIHAVEIKQANVMIMLFFGKYLRI